MSNEKAKFIRAIQNLNDLKIWFQVREELPAMAMVGRSNVGKSTLINALFGSKLARTSKTPGRTRQINVFKVSVGHLTGERDDNENYFYLYDLPGYGHAQVSKAMIKEWKVLMEAFLPTMANHLVLFMQDVRHSNTEHDQTLANYLAGSEIPTFLVFNKLDKLKTQKERSKAQNAQKKIFEIYGWVKQIFFLSALKKKEIESLKLSLVSYLLSISSTTLDFSESDLSSD